MSDQANQQAFNPFSQFINASLDMDGVDGVCLETVAFAVRDVIKSLPQYEDEVWGRRLDRLQQTLRLCLSIELVGRLAQENPDFAEMNPDDLDLMIALTTSLAFITYNEISERLGFDSERHKSEIARLWVALRSAKGWVDKAADEGDPVAQKLREDIGRLLTDTRPSGWKNGTRALPE